MYTAGYYSYIQLATQLYAKFGFREIRKHKRLTDIALENDVLDGCGLIDKMCYYTTDKGDDVLAVRFH